MSENEQTPYKETTETTPQFTLNNIVTICDSGLVLRHDVKKQDPNEKLGDALAIFNISSFLDISSKKLYDLGIPLKKILDILDEDQKKDLVDIYNKAIEEFLADSIGLDINTANKNSLFFVVKYGKRHGFYDESQYYGFGKIGRGSLDYKDILTTDELIINDTPIDQNSFNKLKTTLTEIIKRKIIDSIDRLN